jgi:hypothetical protein
MPLGLTVRRQQYMDLTTGLLPPRLLEKIFWMSVVLTGLTCASLIINTAVHDWKKNPGIVTINTFSKVIVVKLTMNNYVLQVILYTVSQAFLILVYSFLKFSNVNLY